MVLIYISLKMYEIDYILLCAYCEFCDKVTLKKVVPLLRHDLRFIYSPEKR